MALQPNESIGPYMLICLLGRGAFGEVWLARHHHLDEERAVKVPTDAAYVRQLRTEAQIQFRLHHPNIVRTLDLMPIHDPPYYVMEYVAGMNLRQKLRTAGKLSLNEARPILRQILLALEHAHAAGICHRDLKPENILCQTDGVVKVTDFGFGKVQAALAQSMIFSGSLASAGDGSITGTVQYMSPQQQAGEEADPKDDLYAVGVIACELLTGSRPQPMGVTKMLARAGVDVGFAGVLEKAMEQDRKDRYGSAAEMREALDNFGARTTVTSQQVQSRRPPVSVPPPLPARASTVPSAMPAMAAAALPAALHVPKRTRVFPTPDESVVSKPSDERNAYLSTLPLPGSPEYVLLWVVAEAVGDCQTAGDTRRVASRMLNFVCATNYTNIEIHPLDYRFLRQEFERDRQTFTSWDIRSRQVDLLAGRIRVNPDALMVFFRENFFDPDQVYDPPEQQRRQWFEQCKPLEDESESTPRSAVDAAVISRANRFVGTAEDYIITTPSNKAERVSISGTSPSKHRAPRVLDLANEGDELMLHIHMPGRERRRFWVNRSALQSALDGLASAPVGARIETEARSQRANSAIALAVLQNREIEVQLRDDWWIWVSSHELKAALEELGFPVHW